MITLRPAHERGQEHYDWLDSRHTFSFGHYYDPDYLGVSDLLVINDDWVKPGTGFGTHPHRDMEIISYVLEGTIEHKDTMDQHTQLRAGEVQVMSAGSGVRHSEYNPSLSDSLNFLQLWIKPNEQGAQPGYAQKDFSAREGVTLIVSPDGNDGSLAIRQDARIYQLRLQRQSVGFDTGSDRIYYLHVARGGLRVNGVDMSAGDGATLLGENTLQFDVDEQAEALLIDLRMAS